jgi:hypothetical protein
MGRGAQALLSSLRVRALKNVSGLHATLISIGLGFATSHLPT